MVIWIEEAQETCENSWEWRIWMGQGYPRKWNGMRMPKEMKWSKETRKRWNGPRKPKIAWILAQWYYWATGIKQGKNIQQAQKRPNKHESNNNMARVTEWHGRSANILTKRVKNGLEKEKPPIKQGRAQEGLDECNMSTLQIQHSQGKWIGIKEKNRNPQMSRFIYPQLVN